MSFIHTAAFCTLGVLAASLADSGVLAAGEAGSFSDVEILPDYEKALLANPFLMKGSVDVLKVPLDGEVIVGVGVVVNKSLTDPSRESAIRTWRVAQVKASTAIALFLRTDVTTESTLKKKESLKTVQTDADIQRIKRVEKVIKSWTLERSRIALRRVKKVGSWYSADRKYFYIAVRIKAVD